MYEIKIVQIAPCNNSVKNYIIISHKKQNIVFVFECYSIVFSKDIDDLNAEECSIYYNTTIKEVIQNNIPNRTLFNKKEYQENAITIDKNMKIKIIDWFLSLKKIQVMGLLNE